jgi:uncharacterized protein (DUF1697 family)
VTVYVAMLRGINVSGRNRLPMEDLRKLVTTAGGAEVRTYIQSGNAVFASSESGAAVVRSLEAELQRVLGTAIPVLVRSKVEMEKVLKKNPFLGDGADTAALHVTFMGRPPRSADVQSAQARDTGADGFAVVGREVYLRCPHGYGQTKLTNTYFEKQFGSESTTRNWKTVTTLVEMASG